MIEQERALKSLNPSSWQVGLVGYGEVGRILAEDLRAANIAVRAFDLKLHQPTGLPLRAHSRQHGRRRSEELREVAITVADIGLTPHSAAGTVERQAWVADLADSGLFGARGTAGFARSANWRTEADRILTRVKAA